MHNLIFFETVQAFVFYFLFYFVIVVQGFLLLKAHIWLFCKDYST